MLNLEGKAVAVNVKLVETDWWNIFYALTSSFSVFVKWQWHFSFIITYLSVPR